eukprot:IDg21005t1
MNDPSGNTSVTQQIESRQAPAKETALNIPSDDLENVTQCYAQISETHDIEHNSTPSLDLTIPREQVSSHGVDWVETDMNIPSIVLWCVSIGVLQASSSGSHGGMEKVQLSKRCAHIISTSELLLLIR